MNTSTFPFNGFGPFGFSPFASNWGVNNTPFWPGSGFFPGFQPSNSFGQNNWNTPWSNGFNTPFGNSFGSYFPWNNWSNNWSSPVNWFSGSNWGAPFNWQSFFGNIPYGWNFANPFFAFPFGTNWQQTGNTQSGTSEQPTNVGANVAYPFPFGGFNPFMCVNPQSVVNGNPSTQAA
ncbi:MAG: hypothetical protein D6695_11055 [Planctomycetota bacterium]|nr:MAG: hypothetical protein D6695_11055 [Planctomycetota bacterium]